MTQSNQSLWHRLLEKKVSRRTAIGTAVAAGVAGAMPIKFSSAEAAPNNGAPFKGAPADAKAPFAVTAATRADALTLPSGYSYQVVAPWGETIPGTKSEIGFNHDYVGFFPVDMLEGGTSSEDGLLTINHEYANALFVGGDTKERTAKQIEAEMKAVGVSVVRIRKPQVNGRWLRTNATAASMP